MIDKQLLDILCCPETKQDVAVADKSVVDKVNAKIAEGTLTNRGGSNVTEKLDAALLRADGKLLYPVRDNIPVMLIDEGIFID